MTDNPNYFRIMATIERSKKRLAALCPCLTTYEQLKQIELNNIERLENLLAEPMSDDLIQEDFSD